MEKPKIYYSTYGDLTKYQFYILVKETEKTLTLREIGKISKGQLSKDVLLKNSKRKDNSSDSDYDEIISPSDYWNHSDLYYNEIVEPDVNNTVEFKSNNGDKTGYIEFRIKKREDKVLKYKHPYGVFRFIEECEENQFFVDIYSAR